jgi:hypothetical protein
MPSIEHASCASIPATALSNLAGFRASPDVQVQVLGDRAWLRWLASSGQVLQLLLPVPGAAFFVWHEGQWYPPDSRLPTSAVPDLMDPSQLHRVLIPEPAQPIPPGIQLGRPVEVVLRRSERPRACTALWCRLAELASWADTATADEIAEVSAARSGEDVLLRGNRLPASPRGERFWGRDLLVPLGYRPVPDLPERDLCAALGVGEDEFALLRPAGGPGNEGGPAALELLPAEAFEPLTRAAVRLALQEHARP